MTEYNPYRDGYHEGWRDCERAMKEKKKSAAVEVLREGSATEADKFLLDNTWNELAAVRERYQFLLKWRANLTYKSIEPRVLAKIENAIDKELAAKKEQS